MVLLLIFLSLIATAVIYALINLYHIFRFGHFDRLSYFVTGIFMAGFILILFISSTFFFQINWSDSVRLFGQNDSVFSPPTSQTDFSL